MALRPLDGYPTSFGSSRASVFPHAGPSSYTRVTVTPGSAMTGGDTVRATEAGLKYFDTVFDAFTDDGAFYVRAVPLTPSTSVPGAPGATYALIWMANKTATMGGQAQTAGAEAAATTDLSTFTVRLTGLGPK